MSSCEKKILAAMAGQTEKNLKTFDKIIVSIREYQEFISDLLDKRAAQIENMSELARSRTCKSEKREIAIRDKKENTEALISQLEKEYESITVSIAHLTDIQNSKQQEHDEISSKVANEEKIVSELTAASEAAGDELTELSLLNELHRIKTSEILESLPSLEATSLSLSSELAEVESDLVLYKEKTRELEESNSKLFVEIQNYESSIPKLVIGFNELQGELNVLKSRRNAYKEMLVSSKQTKCSICGLQESGRMKKCQSCDSVAHSKCSKDLKFLCYTCKLS